MCTRFAIYSSFEAIKKHTDKLKKEMEMKPNYNAAPTHKIPIILNNADENFLKAAHFGFYPFWVKNTNKAKFIINARAESVAQKPSFKSSFKRKRCLVPANSFYEWSKPNKQPFMFSPTESDMFMMAGIYEKNVDSLGNEFLSVAVITTEPNDIVAKVHNRMPLILDEEKMKKWLFFNTKEDELQRIMTTYPNEKMSIQRVSKEVNSPKNNYESLLEGI